ncbi:MAG: hypothetical protein O2913_05475 [Chloroflexi bacterium]|nr:hypothetical protein [Chloroflexota bacterium]
MNLFELFIGMADYRLLKSTTEHEYEVVSTGTLADGGEASYEIVTRTRSSIELYDYNQPIIIEAPTAGG